MLYAFRMALRQFRLQPAFAFMTVLVLGLGTGAAAVVYTIVDGVVLRALPYRQPDRLVKLWDTNLQRASITTPFLRSRSWTTARYRPSRTRPPGGART